MSILLQSDHYASANHVKSICVQNVAEKFERQGHSVWVHASGKSEKAEIKDGVKVSVHKKIICTQINSYLENSYRPYQTI